MSAISNSTKLFFFFIYCVSFSSVGQNWELEWSDEFNGKALNTTNWTCEIGNGQGGWGTGQLDYSTSRKENVDVRNGKLVITLREEEYQGLEYTSGRIHSRNKHTVKYGKIEARIKVPAGRGIGCAFWMLPQADKYGPWPASGEIDIVETNGHDHFKNYGTVHFKQWEGHHYKGHEIITTKDLTSEMHLYTLIWDENSIKWYLDDSLFNECYIKEPIDGRKPFNEEFFFIVSGGVGSDFSGKKIDHKLLPQTFEVDYIRVYKKFENPFIVSASITANGNEVEVLFSEHLKGPERFLKDFEVRDNNQLLPISSASMKSRDNRTLLLQLSSSITKNSLVTLGYKGDSIQSFHNLVLKKFNSLFVSNNTTGSSPVPLSATTKNDFSIELTINKNLEQTDLKQEDFFVKVNGKEVQFQAAVINQTIPTKIDLKVKNPLFKGDTILLYYKGNNLMSIDKGILQPFSGIMVANLVSEKFSIPGKIEAENYTAQQGMMSESCNDEGGGRNLGYIEEEDWLEYTIYVKKAGKYRIEYRTSSKSATGIIVLSNEESVLTRTTIEPTTNWQVWNTTNSDIFILEEGIQKIKLYAAKGGFNINWFSIADVSL